jgi:hypothetical protein
MSNALALTLGLLAAATAACSYKDPNYCPGNAHDNCLNDGPRPCTATSDCVDRGEVCDVTGTRTCVQCTAAEHDACTGATPACGADHTCRACVAQADCAASACLPDGSCADPKDVAHVAPMPTGSDNAMCTKAMPCTVIAKALATGRPYLRLAGNLNEQVTINNRNVTIFAEPDAKLTSATTGTVLRIDGTSRVAIHDLEIGGASGTDGFGISMPGNLAALTLNRVKLRGNQAGGLDVAGGTITVTRSTIAGNPGGGIMILDAEFVIVGNVITGNGTDSGMSGGVVISAIPSPTTRLEFNSFSGNRAMVGRGAALVCFSPGYTARNNILSGNGSATNLEQVTGNCMHTYSIVRPGTLPPGTGNSSADPLFRDPAAGDLHLQDGSPAQKAADPATDLRGLAELDIDGQVRTAPADIGADEVP